MNLLDKLASAVVFGVLSLLVLPFRRKRRAVPEWPAEEIVGWM